MPIESLDLDGFLRFLKEKQGTQSDRKFAQSLGVSPGYLSDVYKRRTVPGESITRPLSARRALVFEVDRPEPIVEASPKKIKEKNEN